jgi:MHS family alpha-ketoglutarate permease-like MFS transporter
MAVMSEAPATRVVNRGRQLAAATVGQVVEWFDWYAYSILAVYFAGQFFPSSDASSMVPLLSALAVFAAGFLMRPVGGLVMGAVADRRGRKAALTLSITMMGAANLTIGLSPTYAQIGLLAPVLLVVARLVQGISTGGELGAASVFLVESAPPNRRGLFSSFIYIGAMTGNLAAIGISAALASGLSEDAMSSWGWRVPFLIGALAGAVGLWIRRHAEETSTVAEDIESGRVRRPSPFEFLREHPKQSLQVVGITMAPAVLFYVWAVFLPTYASISVGFDKAQALVVSCISLVFFTVLQPITGTISDKVGRKPTLIVFAAGFVIGTVPMLNMLTSSFWSLLLVQCLGLALLSGWSSVSAAVMSELFPARVRATGIGLPYNIAMALFGGTGPYIATWLQSSGHASLFGWYLVLCAVMSLLTYLSLRETRGEPLPE